MSDEAPQARHVPQQGPVPRRQRTWKLAAWIAGSMIVLVALAAITVAVLLHNERFHSYLLRVVQQDASDNLGVPVHLQNFALNLTNLSLELDGLTVEGAAPYAQPALLQVDRIDVGIRIVSLLQRKWYLNGIRVDRPIAHIFVDDHGRSNIPIFKNSGNNNSSTSVFDLAIRHAELDRGEVYYNNRKSALAADLHDLEFRETFNPLLQQYTGRLAYSDGHLVSGSFSPIPHTLNAEFSATPTEFRLEHLTLSTGPSQVSITATVQNYTNPIVDADYDATVDGVQARQVLKSPSIPSGQLRATGHAHYAQTASTSPLNALVLNGDLNSRELDVKTSSRNIRATDVAAHYSLNNGDATLRDFQLRLLGGRLSGSGTMSNIGGDSHSKISAALQGVSLADLTSLAAASSSRSVALNGVLDAQMNASWGSSFNTIVAHADTEIHGNLTPVSATTSNGATPKNSTSAPQAAVPVEGVIHGTYTAGNQQLALNQSYLRTSQTSLTMNGVVSARSSLDVRLQADDLREVEAVADLFRTPEAGHPLQPLGLSGAASFQGKVDGSTSAPHIAGQLVASNLQLHGSAWKVLRADVDAGPSFVSLQHGDLESAERGHLSFDARAGLSNWALSNTSPIQAQIDASQLNIADIAKLTGQQVPVTGTLAASIRFNGTELDPTGSGTISTAALVAYDQPVSSAKLTFSGTGDEAHAALALQMPAGSVQGKVSVRPAQKTFDAQLTASGIDLNKLQALKARNINATGELSVNADGQGSFDNPKLGATLQIPKLVVQNQTITGLKLQLNVADRIANATLATSAVNTNIQAKARVDLSGDYLADATLDTQAIPLQPLLAAYAPAQASSIAGQTEVHATLHGPLKNKNLIKAHINLPALKVAYGTAIQLAAASPIQVDVANGVIVLQRATIRGTDTDLQLQGSYPIAGAGGSAAPMSMMLMGTVNLQLAQLFDPDIRTSGEVKFNINSNGTASSPNSGAPFAGQINIVDAAFASADLPIGLQHANGVLTLTKDRININSFQGTIGGGTLTAQGGVALQPSPRFDLGLAAQGIRMLYPQGMRESADANLRLTGTVDSALLAGSVNLSDLSFTTAFDLNSFISQFSGGVAAPPTPGFSQNLQLNVAVHSARDIDLVSRALSVSGSANLQVRGTAASPVILGRVNLNNGDIILNGNRFLLEGGTIQFVNPSETQPVVNLSMKTSIQQYDLYLRFNGSVDHLRTNYTSNPALPSADIINLLAFGQTTEAASANPSTPANQAAESLVASQVSSQFTSRISKIAGISQLSISPVLTSGTSQGPAGANITIQQRVTGNLFVTFSSNVASTQSQTIQGQYQISPRVAISATRDPNGGFAVDALIKKTW